MRAYFRQISRSRTPMGGSMTRERTEGNPLRRAAATSPYSRDKQDREFISFSILKIGDGPAAVITGNQSIVHVGFRVGGQHGQPFPIHGIFIGRPFADAGQILSPNPKTGMIREWGTRPRPASKKKSAPMTRRQGARSSLTIGCNGCCSMAALLAGAMT